MTTWLASRDCFVTIDVARQTILVARWSSWLPAQFTREIAFADIESVYQDLWQESRTVQHETGDYSYRSELVVTRRWMVGVQLRDGETVIVREEVKEQPAQETYDLGLEQSYWKSVAGQLSDLLGKPLRGMPPVPGGPRTFVESIEGILQRRLEGSPQVGRTVHLRGKDFGVEIVVDGKVYATLDDIEDQNVRGLVQAAIDDWQRTNP